jgi:hypothetical protein
MFRRWSSSKSRLREVSVGSFSRKLGNALEGAAAVATPAAFQVQRQNALEARDKRMNEYRTAAQTVQNELAVSEGDKTRKIQQQAVTDRGAYYDASIEQINKGIELSDFNLEQQREMDIFNKAYEKGTAVEREALVDGLSPFLRGSVNTALKLTTVQAIDPKTDRPVDRVLAQGPEGAGFLNLDNVGTYGGDTPTPARRAGPVATGSWLPKEPAPNMLVEVPDGAQYRFMDVGGKWNWHEWVK